jgi:hypothetical protein
MDSVDSRYVRESTLEILILRSSWNDATGSPDNPRQANRRSELAAHEGGQRFSWKI